VTDVAAGVFLLVLGAILAFAVHADTPSINVHTVGWILMIAGAGILYVARRGATAEKRVTKVRDVSDPDRPVETVTEVVTEHEAPGSHPPPEL
jgi:hypothetical protein